MLKYPDANLRQTHYRLTLNTSADTFCYWRKSDGNERLAFFSLPPFFLKKVNKFVIFISPPSTTNLEKAADRGTYTHTPNL